MTAVLQSSVDSPYVVYASQAGIPMDADLADASVGTDASAAMQAVIDAVAETHGRLELVIDGPIKCKDVKLRSGVTIRGLGGSYGLGGTMPSSGLIQAPGGYSCLRNFNQMSNYNDNDPVDDYSTIIDQDITLRDLFINGNRGDGGINNAAANSGDPQALENGAWISPVQMFGVRNLTLENVCIYDPATFGFWLSYIDGVYFSKLQSYDPVQVADGWTPGRNTDAVHFNGPCRFVNGAGVRGYSGDDFIALNADDGVFGYYEPDLIYFGGINNVIITDLNIGVAASVCRILADVSFADQITIGPAIASYIGAAAYQGEVFTPESPGNHGVIDLPNWQVRTNSGFHYASIDGIYRSLRFTNHTRLGHTSQADTFHLGVKAAADVKLLVIDGYTIPNDQNNNDFGLIKFGAEGGTVDILEVSRVVWRRTNTAAGTLLLLDSSDGTVTDCSIADSRLDGVSNLVRFSDGTLSSLSICGIKHKNANGGATVQVTTQTLARLRAAGLDTALLSATASGGAITSSKSDETEDA